MQAFIFLLFLRFQLFTILNVLHSFPREHEFPSGTNSLKELPLAFLICLFVYSFREYFNLPSWTYSSIVLFIIVCFEGK